MTELNNLLGVISRLLLIIFIFTISNSCLAAINTTQFCGQPFITPLMAGKTINAGTVTVKNDQNGDIYVTYKTASSNIVITEAHLAVAKSLAGIPQTNTGNPKNGLFPYSGVYTPPVTEVTFVIHPDEIGYVIGDTLYIAAHAVVQITNSNSSVQQETAWGNGPGFPGKNWSMYFTYQVQPCPPPPPAGIQPGDFRTQTQGGWGAPCNGNNPGCYRNSHFAAAFPNGLTIGKANLTHALFQTAYDIEQFLPAGGTAGILAVNYNNPTSTSAGVLAGQVAALTLSVQFDLNDPSFGASNINLKDLIVDDSTSACYNWTVEQVLDIANKVLSGANPTPPATINTCVDKINNNFDNGNVANPSFLRLP